MIRRMITDKGNMKYGLPPAIDRKAHDDRAYCCAATAYILSTMRKEDKFGGEAKQFDFMKVYGASQRTLNKINKQKNRSPFSGRSPFGGGKRSY